MTPNSDPAIEAALRLIVDPNRDRALVPYEMMQRVDATAAVIRSAYSDKPEAGWNSAIDAAADVLGRWKRRIVGYAEVRDAILALRKAS